MMIYYKYQLHESKSTTCSTTCSLIYPYISYANFCVHIIKKYPDRIAIENACVYATFMTLYIFLDAFFQCLGLDCLLKTLLKLGKNLCPCLLSLPSLWTQPSARKWAKPSPSSTKKCSKQDHYTMRRMLRMLMTMMMMIVKVAPENMSMIRPCCFCF
jgi:hypothetical protein